MKLDIVLWPHPVLLGGTDPITEVDDDLRAVVGEMRRVMFELRGVGLAAPQVGVAKRLMLVCPSGEPGDEIVVINPEVEILEKGGTEVGDEGCLSFPEIYGKVRRAKKIRVRFQDLDLRGREIELSGFVARIFQHEMDHLDGKVFIDRMEPESRQEVEHLLDALRERYMATTE
ncbi:MAG: peptide deformylase [Planctomycetota bacterium]|nr:peptide deformylase [Planctomycetota bacterium]